MFLQVWYLLNGKLNDEKSAIPKLFRSLALLSDAAAEITTVGTN